MTLRDRSGAGPSVAGNPVADFTARRWTSEDLDAAGHQLDLEPGDRIWLSIDHAQNGLGTGSCGPGVLPRYRLAARTATFTVTFRPLSGTDFG